MNAQSKEMWFQSNLNFTVPFTLFFNLLYNDPIRIKHIWKFFGEHLIFCGFSTNRICTIKATDALKTLQISTFYAKEIVNCTDETLLRNTQEEGKTYLDIKAFNICALFTYYCISSCFCQWKIGNCFLQLAIIMVISCTISFLY